MPVEDPKRLDEILKKSHRMYELLSHKHKKELKKKINYVINELGKKYPDFKNYLEGQHNSPATQSNFIGTCHNMLQDIKSTTRMDDFFDDSQN